jgi:hypothetical protein
MTKGQNMHRFARIGVFISGAAVAFSMALTAPAGAGATSPVPAPHGSYNLHVGMNGGVMSFTVSVTPGSCNAIGCVGTWKPNVGTFVGTYSWHASDGTVTFLHGQDHFYGKMTSTGMNSVTHKGTLVVICPKLGTTHGSWYATAISHA